MKVNYKEGTLEEKLTVDISGLQKILSVGKPSAEKVAREAGAVIWIGKRKLYRVDRIREYLNTL